MAEEREPPPLPGVPEPQDAEDLFVSAMEDAERSLSPEDISSSSNGPKAEHMLLDHDPDPDDLFAEATEEVSLDSPERQMILSDGPSPAVTPVTINPRADVFDRSPDQDEDEEENRDTFDIQISVSDPEKVGDGMNAYMAYKVTTKTSLSIFSRDEVCVKRRFSDFLGLHSKLASKYMHIGYIVPPAPEKSIVGMTKVKVGKEDLSSVEFVEKRRSALERYMLRTVKQPALLKDPDVLQFLESSELPRAVSTQALSGAGSVRVFILKHAYCYHHHLDEVFVCSCIKWFEEKQQQFENLDVQLRKLHASVESLVFNRKELSVNTASFAKSAAMLGNSEDHTALSRALSQLAEVEEKIDQLHQDQACADFYLISELLGDYVRLITAVKGVFDQRMKTWAKCQDAQVMLQRKREAEAKLQHANKPDKLQQAKDEIREEIEEITVSTVSHIYQTYIFILKHAYCYHHHLDEVFVCSCIKWFEEKQQQFENLDVQLRKLHASVESLVFNRKELSVNTASFAKSAAMLGNSEDHTALSRALSQLAEVEEKIDQLHQDQACADFYLISELLGDYVRLITAVKGVFDQRMKTWAKCQDAQVMLQRKREAEAKLQHANKPDKLQQAKDEIREEIEEVGPSL
ncbi:sorting nexin-2 [Sinocyclocheilus anshuiensis]|uniref:sorting nexin-2 n=1 Tax=Sinocyclocheilus anshuiensis TaxID=1608454 RepID=UPI0007B7BF59|nr:PREDICTED: sorting nexin-2-like [Sinocyclocheilus anshuiensis]